MKQSKDNSQYFYDYIIETLSICKIGKLFSKDPYALENYDKLEKKSLDALNKFTNLKFNRGNYFSRDVYPTPNISVRVCIFNEKEEILLVREIEDKGYSLPGGRCDLFDSPSDCAVSECIQEAGAKIKDLKLIGYIFKGTNEVVEEEFRVNAIPECQIIFKAKLDKLVDFKKIETDDVNWFATNNLPKMSHKNSLDDWNRIISNAKDDIMFFD